MTALGGPDKVSMDFIARTRLFVAPGVTDQDRVRRFLIERYFENGAALFGRHTPEEMQDFRDVAGVDWSDEETYAVIQYFVQRVRNYAHLETLAEAGFDEARIPAADHHTPITCIGHCGQIINIVEVGECVKIFSGTNWKEAWGKDIGVPPFDVLCSCRMEGIFEGERITDSFPKKHYAGRSEWDRLNHVYSILEKNRVAGMSESKFSEFYEFAVRVSAELGNNPHPQAALERAIGESLVERNRNAEAIHHLERAISLRPNVGCKKLLKDLTRN